MSDVMSYRHVNDLIKAWRKSLPEAKIFITQDAQKLTLHLIEIPLMKRRQGYGTEILTELCDYADYEGLLISCVVAAEYGTSEKVLQNFYSQHGFKASSSDKLTLLRKPSYKE